MQTYSDLEIAKLLLLESQNRHQSTSGSASTGNALKTNKRFLKSVIRNVNDHNRQLDRKPEGCSNSRPTVENEYGDRSTGSHPHPRSSRFEQELRVEAYRSKSSDRKREKRIHKRSRTDDQDIDDHHHRHTGKNHHLDASPTAPSADQRRDKPSNTDQPLPSTSKMDKYFSSTYDPRLDVNLDDITDPTTGLIEGGNYDDWEAILTQLKAKRDAKSRTKEMDLEKKLVAAQSKLRKIERREKNKSKRCKRKKGEDSDLDQSATRTSSRRKKKLGRKIDGEHVKDSARRQSTRRNDDEDVDEIEASRRKSTKKRRRKSYSTGSDSSDDSTDDEPDTRTTHRCKRVGLMEMKGYSKPGHQREWDLGKPSPT